MANLGKVMTVIKGAYNGSTQYERLDVVTYNSSSWVAKQTTTGNTPPTDGSESNTYWQLMAKGYTGSSFNDLTDKPSTISGYGITNAYTKTEVDNITGDLSELETQSSADLVVAINEVNNNVGNISTLTTTDKTSTVGAINEINNKINQYKLPAKNILYNIDSMAEPLPAMTNLFTNASFYVWPMGTSTTIPTTNGGGKMVCGNWDIKSLTTNCVASKLNAVNGGLNLAMTFDATELSWIYVRQLIPVVTAMSKKTYTFTAEVEVNNTVNCDLYINARFDSSDANRINIVDTDGVVLTAGRHRVACTFTVPDIDSHLASVTAINGLETALRFYGTNQTVNAKVYECVLTEGDNVKTNSIVNPAKDYADVELNYEFGTYQFVGFNTTSGQRRVTVPFRTYKYLVPAITLYDVVGNVGKVSTYDVSGTRTDNVSITTMTITQDDFVVIINDTTVAGIAFTYTANCYFLP